MTKKTITQEDIMKILDACYEKCLNGVPLISPPVQEMANDYLKKYETREKACKSMLKSQIIKCTTSGFITGFGGVVTIPVALPANLTSVIYVQMRMIACAAYMAGCDLKSDQTQTFVYACLAGVTVNEVVKKFGIKFGMKYAEGLIKKIPGKLLVKINQKVGFRFVTKFGTKGMVNLAKLVPGVGAVIGGGLDLIETKIIADRAYKWFINNDFDCDNEISADEEDIVVEISEEEIEEILEESVDEETFDEEFIDEEIIDEEDEE